MDSADARRRTPGAHSSKKQVTNLRTSRVRAANPDSLPADILNNPRYASIVVDVKTGKTLYEAEPNGLRHPAAITKVITLYLLFEQLQAGRIYLTTPLPVSVHAAAPSPTKLGLRPGSAITVEDAIKGVVTRSANDAAVVIAEALGGSESNFAALMTRKAGVLGMSQTQHKNASGLPDAGQVTTAHDLAILGMAIQKRFPSYYKFFSTRSSVFRGNEIGNYNRLLGSIDGIDGIKIGYTNASGFNLLTSIKRDDRQLIAVVMGGHSAGSRDAVMRRLIANYLPRAYAGDTPPQPLSNRVADMENNPPSVPEVSSTHPKVRPAVLAENPSLRAAAPVARADVPSMSSADYQAPAAPTVVVARPAIASTAQPSFPPQWLRSSAP